MQLPPSNIEFARWRRHEATTPDEVKSIRNDLMELIQYKPSPRRLLVPSQFWIVCGMDHEVLRARFTPTELLGAISPPARLQCCLSSPGIIRSLRIAIFRLINYNVGVMAALDAVDAIVPQHKVHACGYRLGGTDAPLTRRWWRANLARPVWLDATVWRSMEIIAVSGLLGASLTKATGSRSTARVAKSRAAGRRS